MRGGGGGGLSYIKENINNRLSVGHLACCYGLKTGPSRNICQAQQRADKLAPSLPEFVALFRFWEGGGGIAPLPFALFLFLLDGC